MNNTWEYRWSSQKLMKALRDATIRAGVSNSGLVFDPTAGYEAREAHYLYGVVLSRLDNKHPPFAPGDKVRMRPRATYYCGSANSMGEHYRRGEAKPNTEYEVWRVFYGKEEEWGVSFKIEKDSDFQHFCFPADRFEKVEQPQPATA